MTGWHVRPLHHGAVLHKRITTKVVRLLAITLLLNQSLSEVMTGVKVKFCSGRWRPVSQLVPYAVACYLQLLFVIFGLWYNGQ